jgi:translation initiation factor IF-2
LSIRHWNKNKGHPKPETFKVDDFIITRQIQELNYKIWEIIDQLNKTSVKISKYYFRGGKTRKSVNLSINSKDGIHPERLLSLAITKHILLDAYTECFDIIQESEIVQIRVEQDELSSLF